LANRHDELAQLRRIVEAAKGTDAPVIVVITGTGGVGKTTLGLHWLHQLRDAYSDGQLFIDLRGFSGQQPLPATEPLERFLRALGVDASAIPAEADEQAALFRSLTAGRRLILMLDNAVSAAQVRPLLPGPGPALVLVTTRRRLSGLAVDGARFVDVDPLDDDGAVELLHRLVGAERLSGQISQARELVALCGRLPLAVCASGARLAARRRWPISRVVRELTDETHRLAAFGGEDDGEMSVQAVFNASYNSIPDDARRLYRLLGLHPGGDFDESAAAALIQSGPDEAARLLDVLAGAALLQEYGEDRYRFHDLLRLHARGELQVTESNAECAEAMARLTDWYLRTAVAADLAVLPGRWHLGDYYATERRPEVIEAASFEGRADALDWLESERLNLVAVVEEAERQGLHAASWQICEALWPLFLLRKHYQNWLDSHRAGLAAARACDDPRAEARMLAALGQAHLNRREFPAAAEHFGRGLRLVQGGVHPLGEASALEGLGTAESATGRHEHAVELFTRARTIHEELGRPRGAALMTRHLGDAFSAAGRDAEAIEHFAEALQFFTTADEPYHQARALTGLADAYRRSGRLDDADEALRTATAVADQVGARHEQAGIRVALAALAEARDEPVVARSHLEAALAIYTAIGAPHAEGVRRRLAEVETPPE
jgi:tetratricopeptide (TPR) repeat protein